MPSTSTLSDAILRLGNQAVLYARRPSRGALQKLFTAREGTRVSINVHRNAPAELMLGPLSVFLAASGFAPQYKLGAYDDSLLMTDRSPAAVEVIWLDYDRYNREMPRQALVTWLSGRLHVLRETSSSPILVAGSERDPEFDELLANSISDLRDVRVAPRFPLTEEYGDEYWDDRMSKLTGSAYSDSALIAQARDLGLGWIPAALSPRLKVVAVDLDNTLYQGVLGEDGIAGVSIAGDFRKIQERLRNLHRQGILLAVVSRNEREDVDALFATRSDFPLRRDHCSVVEAGWGGKADALEKIAGRLRVGLDSVLFVDDNLGELAAVAEALPPVRLAHARSPEQTLALLRHGPGLLRWAEGGEDALRAQDLAVADVREGIAKQGREKGDYLGALGVEVAFAANAASHVERLAELSGKTNQFNLALQRYSAHAVSELQKANDWICITANVKDRLSDSGVVFAMVAKWEADVFRVEELCISCRALGRGLEDMLVVEAIQESLRRRPARRVAFKHRTGPRNAPARDWLERFVGERLAPEGQCDMNWDVALWGARTRDLPVIWRWV